MHERIWWPCLEPGLKRGPINEDLVYPWLCLHPVDPPSTGKWVAGKTSGASKPDLGSRDWRCKMSPLWFERSQRWYGRWSTTKYWGWPLCITLVLKPYPWIWAGLYSSLELPRVQGDKWVWRYSQTLCKAQMGWGGHCFGWSNPICSKRMLNLGLGLFSPLPKLYHLIHLYSPVLFVIFMDRISRYICGEEMLQFSVLQIASLLLPRQGGNESLIQGRDLTTFTIEFFFSPNNDDFGFSNIQ